MVGQRRSTVAFDPAVALFAERVASQPWKPRGSQCVKWVGPNMRAMTLCCFGLSPSYRQRWKSVGSVGC
jgi:hypothetical protein